MSVDPNDIETSQASREPIADDNPQFYAWILRLASQIKGISEPVQNINYNSMYKTWGFNVPAIENAARIVRIGRPGFTEGLEVFIGASTVGIQAYDVINAVYVPFYEYATIFYWFDPSGILLASLRPAATGGLAAVGTKAGDDAAAGNNGEFLEAKLLFGSAITLTTTVVADIISLSLTAGDWDVEGLALFQGGATTTVDYLGASISLVSATFPTGAIVGSVLNAYMGGIPFSFAQILMSTGRKRISLAATTTVYLVGLAKFAVAGCTSYGQITARRVR